MGLKWAYRRLRVTQMADFDFLGYAIFCRLEAGDDAVSGRNLKIVEGYILVNFEIISSNNVRDFQKKKPTIRWG